MLTASAVCEFGKHRVDAYLCKLRNTPVVGACLSLLFLFFYFFAPPIHVLCSPPRSLFLSVRSRNSDPRSPRKLFSPLPTTVRAFAAIAITLQSFLLSSSDSHRIVPTHVARRSQRLIPFYFLFFLEITRKSDQRGIRTPEPTLVWSVQGNNPTTFPHIAFFEVHRMHGGTAVVTRAGQGEKNFVLDKNNFSNSKIT